jgi:zinc D-Ala-D-Ala carboxypeptidase
MKAQWDKQKQLYPNFTKEEFDCKHTGLNEMDHEFMLLLQHLRVRYGKPMRINSGYRHPSHPVESRKGHSNGEHTKGRCADIAVASSSERFELLKLAFELGFTRIGFHKSFLHLGLGAQGLPNKVVWDY